VDNKEDKENKALEAKQLGNKLYGEKKYDEAIEMYSKAIEWSQNSVFYCNRAACYFNLNNHEKAIEDCTTAISLDRKYVKAYHRRALAHEKLSNLRSALNDFTAVCALEGFQNQASMAAPDRILKVIASQKAIEISKTKQLSIPSQTFITAYLDSFRATPTDADIINELEDEDESVKLLKQVYIAKASRNWQESLDFVTKSIEANTFTDDKIKAKALNYRGTLLFLMGNVNDAVADLENALLLDQENVNTIIKRATLYMEKGDFERTIDQFKKAELIAPNHPDLYYHRGQVKFLTGDFNGAVEDYSKSLQVESPQESTVYVHIQLGVAKYKLGDYVGAEKKFREAKKAFPNSAEVWNYHGEILLDKQSYLEGIF
jgi:import receptor subunit TOM70